MCVLNIPGTPSVLFFLATLPLKSATIALKIGHLAFQVPQKRYLQRNCWEMRWFATCLYLLLHYDFDHFVNGG